MPVSAAAAREILAKLEAQHPDADTELNYRNAFELLVATILSAQSTDQRVNMVTPKLFARYGSAAALAKATPAEIKPLIVQTGFFRQKAKAIIGMSRRLVEKHGGEVPADMQALVELPGVGRKTANVVLGHALGVPGLPVDRHVLRVANRIGLVHDEDPEHVEQQLMALWPREEWTRGSDTLILHGRRICRPKPLCSQCAVQDDCEYYAKVIAPGERGETQPRTGVPERPSRRAPIRVANREPAAHASRIGKTAGRHERPRGAGRKADAAPIRKRKGPR